MKIKELRKDLKEKIVIIFERWLLTDESKSDLADKLINLFTKTMGEEIKKAKEEGYIKGYSERAYDERKFEE